MKKTLVICAMAACLAACAQHQCNECARNYEYIEAATCSTCAQPAPTCNTCFQPIQPVIHQQPKTIVVVLPPVPQPVVEQEIIYQPEPKCGCQKKCGCKKCANQK